MRKHTMTHHNKIRTTYNYTRLIAPYEEDHVNAKESTTFYMETEHEMLGWTPLSQRRQEVRLILFYKIMNGFGTSALRMRPCRGV